MNNSVTLTFNGARRGIIAITPFMPSMLLYGMAFGVMAASKGLSSLETALFSAIVFAGGAQMASLQAWADPVPLLAVTITTFAMNARYLLLGATMRPWMGTAPALLAYPSLFLLVDANWMLALREQDAGRRDLGFLIGSGALCWVLWIASTTFGQGVGQLFENPRAYGVDFILAAFFATMIVPFLKNSKDFSPLIVGVSTAIVIDQMFQGPWAILSGALAGSLAGALRYDGTK